MERGRDILLVAHEDIQIGRDHGRFKVAEGTLFADFARGVEDPTDLHECIHFAEPGDTFLEQ